MMLFEQFLLNEKQQPYFKQLKIKLIEEYENYDVYPPIHDLFNCFKDIQQLKVVILGQDPYHQKGQANGLAFSVHKGVKIPPSLKNIYHELSEDLGIDIPTHGDLSAWVKEGVLLLNNVLSVRDSQPNSHFNLGWHTFVEHTIQYINQLDEPIVYILWGKNAISKKKLVTNPQHFVIESAHPSPLSAYRGFFGSKPFSKANNYLVSHGKTPVNWGSINV